MRAVDNDILGKLRAVLDTGGEVHVHDGLVVVDNTSKVVEYPLPFVVYYSNVGDDHEPRLSGRSTRHSVFFSVTYVGLSRDQAKWAGEKVRAALFGKRVDAGNGARSWLISLDESQRVRRDDDAIRPGGEPLFYGVDNYSVSITINQQGAPA